MNTTVAFVAAVLLASVTHVAAADLDQLPPEVTLHLNDGMIDPWTTGDLGFAKQFVTLPGKEQIANTPFGPIVILARADQTGGNVGIFRTTEPAGSVGPSHAHTGEVEVFYVLDGTYRFVTGGVTYDGGPGMTIVIPPNVINHYENIGADEGHLLVWEMPGGFEQFFMDIDATKAATPAAIAKLEIAHGITNSSLLNAPK